MLLVRTSWNKPSGLWTMPEDHNPPEDRMIELTQQAAVAQLHIRRADKRNALTQLHWQALLDHVSAVGTAVQLAHPDAPRVLVLQGEPGVFCAGADIEEMSRLVQDAQALAHNNRVVAAAQMALEQLPLPTLALIDGPCFGGGFGLAAACDFRLGSTRSRFAVTPARLGLLYSLEDTRRVLRLLGDAKTRRLLLRSEVLDAEAALAWGVLDARVEPEALAALGQTWAAELAAQPRTSMAGIKATLQQLSQPDASGTAAVRAAFDAAFTSADFAEGSAAFLAGRPPRFP